MKKFVAIIGPKDAGKTTIIRCLTGLRKESFRGLISDRSNNNCIYVIANSPQEQRLTLKEFDQNLEDISKMKNCLGLIIALQPYTRRGYDSMEKFFELVHNRQSFDKYAFILNPVWNGSPQDFNAIQNRLNQFAPQFAQLNARRFPFLNASQIQQASNIFT